MSEMDKSFQQGSYANMKKIVALTLLALFLAAPVAIAADALPLTVAGITLGKDVKEYSKLCNMKNASLSPDAPFLTDAHLEADAIPGIRGGSIIYANCEDVGKVVRVKLKFFDRSQRFFDKLVKEYKKAYGDPNSYEGDAFKNVIAWRWNFVRDGEKVSVLLMWSRKNDIRPGVSIKMSLDSKIESEYKCYKKKFAAIQAKKGGPSMVKDIDFFVAK